MENNITVLISEDELDKRIQELGEQISRDYAGKEVHLICVLKGGAFFMCELAKRITIPVSLDFMSVSSYGDASVSSGIVRIVKDLDKPYLVVENRRAAIARAMEIAQADDIIVLCGKGHETYQILGTVKTHLDEREVVAGILREE